MLENKSINLYTKTELLSLSIREYRSEHTKIYNSIIVLPTRKKHDSGYGIMAIIGVVSGEPIEILSLCSDDICWKTPKDSYSYHSLRTDCLLKSGGIHFWLDGYCFKVGEAYSSIDIELVKK